MKKNQNLRFFSGNKACMFRPYFANTHTHRLNTYALTFARTTFIPYLSLHMVWMYYVWLGHLSFIFFLHQPLMMMVIINSNQQQQHHHHHLAWMFLSSSDGDVFFESNFFLQEKKLDLKWRSGFFLVIRGFSSFIQYRIFCSHFFQ